MSKHTAEEQIVLEALALLMESPDRHLGLVDLLKLVATLRAEVEQLKAAQVELPEQRRFNWFENHGDDDGNNSYTICYGNPDEPDHIIVGCEDTEEDATEACKRLNAIMVAENARLRESERGQLALLRDCAYGSYFHTEIAKRREKIKKFLSKYEEANKPTDEQGAKG